MSHFCFPLEAFCIKLLTLSYRTDTGSVGLTHTSEVLYRVNKNQHIIDIDYSVAIPTLGGIKFYGVFKQTSDLSFRHSFRHYKENFKKLD